MKLISEQSITDLRISVPDLNGEQVRLKDCDDYTVKVYTSDPNEYIEITVDEELKLYGRKLKRLLNGSVKLDISYTIDGYSSNIQLTSGYYFLKTGKQPCPDEHHPDLVKHHVYTKWNEIQGDLSDNTQLVNYIATLIADNVRKVKWGSLTNEERKQIIDLFSIDVMGFTNVMSEDDYQALVEAGNIDPDVFYFTYED